MEDPARRSGIIAERLRKSSLQCLLFILVLRVLTESLGPPLYSLLHIFRKRSARHLPPRRRRGHEH
jgi:hypothetical protein